MRDRTIGDQVAAAARDCWDIYHQDRYDKGYYDDHDDEPKHCEQCDSPGELYYDDETDQFWCSECGEVQE